MHRRLRIRNACFNRHARVPSCMKPLGHLLHQETFLCMNRTRMYIFNRLHSAWFGRTDALLGALTYWSVSPPASHMPSGTRFILLGEHGHMRMWIPNTWGIEPETLRSPEPETLRNRTRNYLGLLFSLLLDYSVFEGLHKILWQLCWWLTRWLIMWLCPYGEFVSSLLGTKFLGEKTVIARKSTA